MCKSVLRVLDTDLLEPEVVSDDVRVCGDYAEVRLAPYEIKTFLIEVQY